MKPHKHIGHSFFTAWLTAWALMILLIVAGSMMESGAFNISGAAVFFAFMSIYTCIGTFLVVGATWLLVAAPYYLCFMRHHDNPVADHLIGAIFAVTITGIITGADSGVWPYLTIIAVLTSITGIHTLHRSTAPEAQ